jgi:hypothetical protein
LGVYIWDSETGETLQRFDDLGRCGGFVNSISSTHMAVGRVSDDKDGCFDPRMDPYVLELISTTMGMSSSSPAVCSWRPSCTTRAGTW